MWSIPTELSTSTIEGATLAHLVEIALPPHLSRQTQNFFLVLHPHEHLKRSVDTARLVLRPEIRWASSISLSSVSMFVRMSANVYRNS